MCENNCLGMILKCKFMFLFRIFFLFINLILRKVKIIKKFYLFVVLLGYDLKMLNIFLEIVFENVLGLWNLV